MEKSWTNILLSLWEPWLGVWTFSLTKDIQQNVIEQNLFSLETLNFSIIYQELVRPTFQM